MIEPHMSERAVPPAASAAGKLSIGSLAKATGVPVVVVPQDMFVYPDRKRVFYRVQVGDTVQPIQICMGDGNRYFGGLILMHDGIGRARDFATETQTLQYASAQHCFSSAQGTVNRYPVARVQRSRQLPAKGAHILFGLQDHRLGIVMMMVEPSPGLDSIRNVP